VHQNLVIPVCELSLFRRCCGWVAMIFGVPFRIGHHRCSLTQHSGNPKAGSSQPFWGFLLSFVIFFCNSLGCVLLGHSWAEGKGLQTDRSI